MIERILPDGFTGAIMAVESIRDAAVLLHGPGGCRVRHMTHSNSTMNRNEEFPMGLYYYGFSRVPATYLDEYDFINGALYKTKEALPIVTKRAKLTAIIDSPGAALIGDNHSKAIIDTNTESMTITISESFASKPMPQSYDNVLSMIIEKVVTKERNIRKNSILILGLSIMDKDWDFVLDELSSYLEKMGLEVLCAPGAGASVDQLAESIDAEYCVSVCPEFCTKQMKYYKSKNIKIIDAPVPIGFDGVKSWIQAVANATGKDPSSALIDVKKYQNRVHYKLKSMRYNSSKIKGLSFSVAGTCSVVLGMTKMLYSYLAMAPRAIKADDGYSLKLLSELKTYLKTINYEEVFDKEPVDCDVIFCEGLSAKIMERNGLCLVGIPIGYSTMGLDDIIPRPIYGAQGVSYILDEIMHAIREE